MKNDDKYMSFLSRTKTLFSLVATSFGHMTIIGLHYLKLKKKTV